MNHWIKNFDALAVSPERKLVLRLAEEGFQAIDTESVIKNSIKLKGNTLKIRDNSFNLKKFRHIYVIGFGKASCKAAFALEQILGNRISDGVAIGLKPLQCEFIRTYEGTHPKPSEENVKIAQSIVEMAGKLKEDDLVITIVSGGGSALLCWPIDECRQGEKLYGAALKSGIDIKELNTVRKHISQLKGGGLAKKLYPATVVGLIFSDVPGDNYSTVASGPTYKDTSTMEDAKKVIHKYGLGEFELRETPKEDKYFKKVVNIPLVSNLSLLDAIKNKADELGLDVKILSSALYDSAAEATEKFLAAAKPGTVILGAGEIKVVVTKEGGNGGRNCYMGMAAINKLRDNDTLALLSSDGLDNSDCAGVILDKMSQARAKQLVMDPKEYLENYHGYTFFQNLGNELIFTGPTEANVSDFYIFYRTK